MQQQLADMTAQLGKVETEHEQLTGRSAMLEQVLHSHQQQLHILHDQQKVPGRLHAARVVNSHMNFHHVYLDSMFQTPVARRGAANAAYSREGMMPAIGAVSCRS